MRLALADLQRLLSRLITAPGGIEDGAARETALQDGGVGAFIAGNGRLGPAERLGIYANAYFSRLHEIFKDEFACTYAVLGEVNFHNLITGYLTRYPPTEPSVFYAGRYLPQYLEGIEGLPGFSIAEMPFVADLAHLERTCIEVFHGPDARSLDQNSLRHLTPESWPSLRIRLHPTARIMDMNWRVDSVMAAIKEKREWQPPSTGPATLLVWRQDWQVRYRALDRGERAALKIAAQSTDFATLCQAFADELQSTDIELASLMNRTLSGWLRDGILIGENISRF